MAICDLKIHRKFLCCYRSRGVNSSHSQAARQMALQGRPAFRASETVRDPNAGSAT